MVCRICARWLGLHGRIGAFEQVFEVVSGRGMVHSSSVGISKPYAASLTVISAANTVVVGACLGRHDRRCSGRTGLADEGLTGRSIRSCPVRHCGHGRTSIEGCGSSDSLRAGGWCSAWRICANFASRQRLARKPKWRIRMNPFGRTCSR